MTRSQFWILTVCIVLLGTLFIVEIFLSRQVRIADHNIGVLERVAQEGNGYSTRWEQLAVRIYQVSQQDAALKDVLVRQQINIAAQTPAKPSSSPAPQTSAPLAPDSTAK